LRLWTALRTGTIDGDGLQATLTSHRFHYNVATTELFQAERMCEVLHTSRERWAPAFPSRPRGSSISRLETLCQVARSIAEAGHPRAYVVDVRRDLSG
jgi:hypothetical protein